MMVTRVRQPFPRMRSVFPSADYCAKNELLSVNLICTHPNFTFGGKAREVRRKKGANPITEQKKGDADIVGQKKIWVS
ncbi:MAG: hypothetical protein CM15mP103_11270 [Gammaproteobacteria bacterium]|nr:MAG: hypothetical protein CM15mP103_11270 [Gammaproteobacteria bacterium]